MQRGPREGAGSVVRGKTAWARRRREEREDEGAACVAPGRTGDGRDAVGSHVGWKILREEILREEEAVGVSAAEGGRDGGTAARRGEEAGACAAQVREDAVDNARVGDEADDTQSGRAGRAGKRLDFEHTAQELGPGEAPGAGGALSGDALWAARRRRRAQRARGA